jgi:hypothetical protein
MDPPQINYIYNNCLLVVNPQGKMRQLFTPFKVQVLYDTSHFKEKSWVFVEEVKSHPQYILLYRVINHWWPYYVFRIDVRF